MILKRERERDKAMCCVSPDNVNSNQLVGDLVRLPEGAKKEGGLRLLQSEP